jgi:hypothetical protein
VDRAHGLDAGDLAHARHQPRVGGRLVGVGWKGHVGRDHARRVVAGVVGRERPREALEEERRPEQQHEGEGHLAGGEHAAQPRRARPSPASPRPAPRAAAAPGAAACRAGATPKASVVAAQAPSANSSAGPSSATRSTSGTGPAASVRSAPSPHAASSTRPPRPPGESAPLSEHHARRGPRRAERGAHGELARARAHAGQQQFAMFAQATSNTSAANA